MLGLALALLLAACDSTPDAAKPDGPHPALWEITDSAGAVEGWLFGTIHALPTAWFDPWRLELQAKYPALKQASGGKTWYDLVRLGKTW